jgi:excisionase family DNA binding protein
MATAHEPITVSEAARILCVAEDTVRRLADTGSLFAARTTAGVRIFERAQVVRLAQERALLRQERSAR